MTHHRRRRALRLALRRRHRPRAHRADLHRLADRLLRPGRLRRRHGLRPEPHPRRARSPPHACSPRRAPPAGSSIHTREGHRPDLSDCPPNKLWRSKQHRRRHRRRRARAAASSCAASRAGRSCPRWPRSTASSIIDKPGKGAFYATDLDLLLRTRGDHPPRLHRHHHRRVRAHDDARGQRPRLRVPAAHRLHRAPPTSATTRPPLKMVTMQGGVFGAVAPSAALLAAHRHDDRRVDRAGPTSAGPSPTIDAPVGRRDRRRRHRRRARPARRARRRRRAHRSRRSPSRPWPTRDRARRARPGRPAAVRRAVRGEGQHRRRRRRRPPRPARASRTCRPTTPPSWPGCAPPAPSWSARPTSTSSPPAWSAPARRYGTPPQPASTPRLSPAARARARRWRWRSGWCRSSLGTDTAGSGRVPAAHVRHRRVQADARPGQHRRRGAGRAAHRLHHGVRRAPSPTPRVAIGVAGGYDAARPVRPARAPVAAAARTVGVIGVPAAFPDGLARRAPPSGVRRRRRPAAVARRTSSCTVDLGAVPRGRRAPVRRAARGRALRRRRARPSPRCPTTPIRRWPPSSAAAPAGRRCDAYATEYRLAELAPAVGAGVRRRSTRWRCRPRPAWPRLADVAADPLGANARLGRLTTFANLLDLAAWPCPWGCGPTGCPPACS